MEHSNGDVTHTQIWRPIERNVQVSTSERCSSAKCDINDQTWNLKKIK